MARKKSRAKQLEELKELLLEKRGKIIDHLLDLEGASKDDLQLSGDPADIASVEISQSALHKLGDREKKLLKKIDHALTKFEDDTYGICELTGDEIPIERLRARPEAQYTVEAKEMLERRERGFRAAGDDGINWDFDSDA